MAIAISHTFVSAKADGGDTSLVQPSNWNAAHSLTGFGTGVETALAVNVGSAGAPVLFDGAGGTPSSLTLTNATGLPIGGIASLGTGVATALGNAVNAAGGFLTHGNAAVLTANTFTGDQTLSSASLILSGNISAAAWTTSGIRVKAAAATLTDTSSSGTVTAAYTNVIGADTIAASSATTYTDYGNLYVAEPVAGSNVTLTNKWSIVAAGGIKSSGRVWAGTNSHLGWNNNDYFRNASNASVELSIGGGWEAAFVSNVGIKGYASMKYGWTATAWPSAIVASAIDTALGRNAAGVVEVNNGTAGTFRDLISRYLYVAPSSANGQKLGLLELTELTTIAAAATTDTTIQMPAGAIVLAVSVRVTTVIPDATSFDVGDSGSANRFNTAAVGVAANSTDAGTKAGAYYNASALSVRLTMNGTPPAANTGRVRVTIYYFLSTPPTS